MEDVLLTDQCNECHRHEADHVQIHYMHVWKRQKLDGLFVSLPVACSMEIVLQDG